MYKKTLTVAEINTLAQCVSQVTLYWGAFVTVACDGETEDGPAPLSPATKQRLMNALEWLWDNKLTHAVNHIIPADFWSDLLDAASDHRKAG
jgi:hypothetical protein